MAERQAILIAGPTASGKSALALELARRYGGAVVNADSMQVYSELRVLTARPSREEMALAPHRLYGVVSGARPFSVGLWLERAAEALDAARAEGRVPIVVGGTGLYFEALTRGLAAVPPIPERIREKWRRLRAEQGLPALRAALAAHDAGEAARTGSDDPQRLVRALEVLEATGRPLSQWQGEPAPSLLDASRCLRVVLAPPRTTVYARADERAGRMLEQGALAEVEALLARGLAADAPVMKAIGVAECAAVLDRSLSRDAALERMRTRTRRYAKRQLTWFRNRMADWRWISVPDEFFGLSSGGNSPE